MNHEKILLYLVTMLMGIALYVILQGYVIALDTSAWNFSGAAFIIAMLPILPVLFLISLIVIPVYFIVEEAD